MIFQALTPDDLAQIVELAVFALQRRLKERRLTLAVVTPDAEPGSPSADTTRHSARPLRRLIQSGHQDRLAMAILSGGVHDGRFRAGRCRGGQRAALVLTSRGCRRRSADDDDVIEAKLIED